MEELARWACQRLAVPYWKGLLVHKTKPLSYRDAIKDRSLFEEGKGKWVRMPFLANVGYEVKNGKVVSAGCFVVYYTTVPFAEMISKMLALARRFGGSKEMLDGIQSVGKRLLNYSHDKALLEELSHYSASVKEPDKKRERDLEGRRLGDAKYDDWSEEKRAKAEATQLWKEYQAILGKR
jgi:hypothetical protein